MIIFDSSYLVVLLHPNPAPARDRENKPVTQFKERVAYLTARMDVSNEPIGLPTPAMAEVLVRSGAARARYMSVLGDTWKFQVLPFDSRAAIEAADLVAEIKSQNEKWETWAKVKFDIQIVSIAKAESATVIYSDDRDIERFARRLKIKVIRICDLPLPPVDEATPAEQGPVGSQQSLNLTVPQVEQSNIVEMPQREATIEDGSKTADPRSQADNKLETNPPYPAPFQRSDSGRIEGETATEGTKKTNEE